MTDQSAAGTPDSPMPDKADEPPVAGNVTVEGHGKFTGRDDNSINVTDSPGAIVGHEITVVQQVAPGKTRRLTDVEGYLAAVREYCANLPYLTLHDIRPTKTLDEVYVPLRARPLPRKDEGKSQEEQEHLEREAFRTEPLSIAEVMRQRDAPHVLILGEPGAGKSTLVRQMAERAWDAPQAIGLSERHLPLLVPLRLLASASGALDERLSAVLKNEMALPRALPDGFFDEWSQQTGARWLILLDALDEVPDSERARLMQWLKGQLLHLQEHRVVITSRPPGYKDDFDATIFGHYDLQPFTIEQTGEFAYKWFNDKAVSFLKELGRIRTSDLRGTPLLLTIAAKVFSEYGTLPERRSMLYKEFIDIWLQEAQQRDEKHELDERLWDVALFALARLAWAMTLQIDQLSEQQLGHVAAEYLNDALHLGRDEAEINGLKIARVLARRSGVFTRRGNTYQFIHPTFREYLTSRAVVRGCEQDLECLWQCAVSRWNENGWRQVAQFVLEVLGDLDIEITTLLRRIMKSKHELALQFVGTALASQVKVADSFANDIVNELLDLGRCTGFGGLLQATDALLTLSEIRTYQSVSKGLLALACNEQLLTRVRELAAEILEMQGHINEAAEARQALARDELAKAEMQAALSLARLGDTDVSEAMNSDSKRTRVQQQILAQIRNKKSKPEW